LHRLAPIIFKRKVALLLNILVSFESPEVFILPHEGEVKVWELPSFEVMPNKVHNIFVRLSL
jgi:hypothetical protein